jgi:hypothetical protein
VYENGGAIVSDEGLFAPRRVMKALLEHAGHSLGELILERDEFGLYEDEIDTVSLHGFQRLKVLRCSRHRQRRRRRVRRASRGWLLYGNES